MKKLKINPNKNCVIGFGITEKSIGKLEISRWISCWKCNFKEITKSLEKNKNPVTNVANMVKI